MAFRCDLCGKRRIISRQQRHHRGVAGGKWKHRAPRTLKVVKPNLHNFNGVFKGQTGHWRLCTKCLRKVKEEQEKLTEKPKTKEPIKKPGLPK